VRLKHELDVTGQRAPIRPGELRQSLLEAWREAKTYRGRTGLCGRRGFTSHYDCHQRLLVDSKFTSPYADQIQRLTLRMFTPSTTTLGRPDYSSHVNSVCWSGGDARQDFRELPARSRSKRSGAHSRRADSQVR